MSSSHPTGAEQRAGRGEQGVALLLAVGALVVLGFISLTAVTLARTEMMAGLGALARVQARGAAEAAVAEALQGWPVQITPVSPGAETLLSQIRLPGPADGRASVRALGGSIYALRAEGVRRAASGRLLATVRMELLVLPGVPDSNSVVHPTVYPRGWRLLP